MKTILIFVTTLDGKITKWGDPKIRSWSSKDDQDYFDTVWNETRVIIIGSGTYNPDPVKPDSKHHLIVMTGNPEKYKSVEVPGHLEFTNELPEDIVSFFKSKGEDRLLIVGGARIATSFLKKELIDELWLTFEPKIFGIGSNFVIGEKLDISLKLVSCSTANRQGTIMAKYLVLHANNKKKEL
jgi:dihydrofolate reductase